ncbi:MAG: hypothetical protein HYW23_00865 [Candidatus Aenigmarchaeota archaeon]|nr:hypothetical protein [Candidatus Aenigmarchaeota archaeon]
MSKRAHKFEIFVDSLIPLAILLIILVTIAEIFFSSLTQQYYWAIDAMDLFIVVLFGLDLLFKLKHARSVPNFLKTHWIYILAVFPFFIVFRLLERFYSVSTIPPGYTVILGRYVTSLIREIRLVRFAEIFSFLGLSPKWLRALYFYENPKIRHKIKVTKLLRTGIKRK